MKRRMATGLLALILLVAQGALAQAPARYVIAAEEAVLAQGLALQTEASFAWGGLPLLDEEVNDALESLASVTRLQMQRQGTGGAGYTALDLLLQNVSVADLAMQVQDGVYYEQSSLLGGQTLAFTPASFAAFMARLSATSQGVLPLSLDVPFRTLMQALGAQESAVPDTETLDDATAAWLAWQQTALTETEALRPKVYTPGLYGARADVTEITRAEMLALAQTYSDLLADNDGLWRAAAEAQLFDADEATLHETAQAISALMRDLPQMLAEWLPENLKPTMLRTVYDVSGALIAKQVEIPLPDGAHVFFEWVPAEYGVPPLYVSLSVGEASLTLLVSREDGQPQTAGRVTNTRNRYVAQWQYAEPQLAVDIMMTRSERLETRADRETVITQTDWMMQSDALLGEGAVVTLSVETTDAASGAGKDYIRRQETIVKLKGLGFDDRTILTCTSRTTAVQAEAPALPPAAEIVHPDRMDDEAFAEWISETQVSLIQAWLTVLGRLPSDVAQYVLSLQ